jgi:hypothetical protein
LILTVVLTTVLAIVGILFVMLSRMDRISASASSQARQLDLAVDAVIAAIDDQLAQDVPGVVLDKAGRPVAEYEDCPNARDVWLASLEPDPNGGKTPFWPQVSVLQGTQPISRLRAEIVTERTAIDPNESSPADADGDGVADACWFRLQDVATGKAQPVYAAVRIIDHGAMLNVNSAYTLDTAGPASGQDGSNQMQIDLVAMAMRKVQDANAAALSRELNNLRAGGEDPCAYLSKVVWNYGDAPAPFCPFDLSDELELRNRFLLNNREGFQGPEVVVSRIERLWRYGPKSASWVFCPAGAESKDVPYDDPSGDIPKWLARATWVEPGGDYDYRHISTTVNMDRVIDPLGRRMLNVNAIRDANDVNDLYKVLMEGGLEQTEAAQVAVNIRDFVDSDTTVTAFKPAGSSVTYYGMEPQPFVRQIGFKVSGTDPVNQANNEFMVELHNPYDADIELSSFTLFLLDSKGERAGLVAFKNGERIKARQSLVLVNRAAATLGQGLGDRKNYDNLVLALYGPQGQSFALSQKRDLLLIRTDSAALWCDRQRTDNAWFDWGKIKDVAQYYARDNGGWKILYPRMPRYANAPFLSPKYNLPQPQPILTASGSAAKGFATLGDVGRVFRMGPSADANSPTGLIRVLDQTPQPSDEQVCLNVADPCVAGVFQRLTVLAPESFGHAATETRVKGRININTAPAFVLERLPWLAWASDTKLKATGRWIGQAIVADRAIHGPFRSISDLMRVPEMECLVDTVNDQSPNGPDLTADSEPNDLEERDLLFDRISNLVTVRSDVFSAYILVRIGVDGPQRRVLAILDRSGLARSGGKVQCIALHVVPDPR